jgi:hypothetical protein
MRAVCVAGERGLQQIAKQEQEHRTDAADAPPTSPTSDDSEISATVDASTLRLLSPVDSGTCKEL